MRDSWFIVVTVFISCANTSLGLPKLMETVPELEASGGVDSPSGGQLPTAQDVHRWIDIKSTSLHLSWSDRFSIAINKAVTAYALSLKFPHSGVAVASVVLHDTNYLHHKMLGLNPGTRYLGELEALVGPHHWPYRLLNFTVTTPVLLSGFEVGERPVISTTSETSDLKEVTVGIHLKWNETPYKTDGEPPVKYILKIWNKHQVIRVEIVTRNATELGQTQGEFRETSIYGLALDKVYKMTLQGLNTENHPGITLSFIVETGSLFASESVFMTGGVAGCFSALQVRCPNSERCVSPYWICDGSQDCPDGADEAVCNEDEPCEDGFRCWGSNKCLPMSWRCDGYEDCQDGEDELGCSNCGGEELLRCGTGSDCVSIGYACDGQKQCPDGWDETDAICNHVIPNFIETLTSGLECPSGKVSCGLNGGCVASDAICNNVPDCPTGEDESPLFCGNYKSCTRTGNLNDVEYFLKNSSHSNSSDNSSNHFHESSRRGHGTLNSFIENSGSKQYGTSSYFINNLDTTPNASSNVSENQSIYNGSNIHSHDSRHFHGTPSNNNNNLSDGSSNFSDLSDKTILETEMLTLVTAQSSDSEWLTFSTERPFPDINLAQEEMISGSHLTTNAELLFINSVTLALTSSSADSSRTSSIDSESSFMSTASISTPSATGDIALDSGTTQSISTKPSSTSAVPLATSVRPSATSVTPSATSAAPSGTGAMPTSTTEMPSATIATAATLAAQSTSKCPGDEFDCGDGWCVPLFWLCDGRYDCLDGADESPKICNSVINGVDQSVEVNYVETLPEVVQCPSNHLQCSSGLCLDNSKLCDGVRDCPENEDEISCEQLIPKPSIGEIPEPSSNDLSEIKQKEPVTFLEGNDLPIIYDDTMISQEEYYDLNSYEDDRQSTQYFFPFEAPMESTNQTVVSELNPNNSNLTSTEDFQMRSDSDEVRGNIINDPSWPENSSHLLTAGDDKHNSKGFTDEYRAVTGKYINTQEGEAMIGLIFNDSGSDLFIADKYSLNLTADTYSSASGVNDTYNSNLPNLDQDPFIIKTNFSSTNQTNLEPLQNRFKSNDTDFLLGVDYDTNFKELNETSSETEEYFLSDNNFTNITNDSYWNTLNNLNTVNSGSTVFASSVSESESDKYSPTDMSEMLLSAGTDFQTVVENVTANDDYSVHQFLNDPVAEHDNLTKSSLSGSLNKSFRTNTKAENVQRSITSNVSFIISGSTSEDGFLVLSTSSTNDIASGNSTILIAVHAGSISGQIPEFVIHNTNGTRYNYDVIQVLNKPLKRPKIDVLPAETPKSEYVLEKVITFRLESNGKLQYNPTILNSSLSTVPVLRSTNTRPPNGTLREQNITCVSNSGKVANKSVLIVSDEVNSPVLNSTLENEGDNFDSQFNSSISGNHSVDNFVSTFESTSETAVESTTVPPELRKSEDYIEGTNIYNLLLKLNDNENVSPTSTTTMTLPVTTSESTVLNGAEFYLHTAPVSGDITSHDMLSVEETTTTTAPALATGNDFSAEEVDNFPKEWIENKNLVSKVRISDSLSNSLRNKFNEEDYNIVRHQNRHHKPTTDRSNQKQDGDSSNNIFADNNNKPDDDNYDHLYDLDYEMGNDLNPYDDFEDSNLIEPFPAIHLNKDFMTDFRISSSASVVISEHLWQLTLNLIMQYFLMYIL